MSILHRFCNVVPDPLGRASRLGELGAGGDVVVTAAVAASAAQPVLPLADHGVRLSATARW